MSGQLEELWCAFIAAPERCDRDAVRDRCNGPEAHERDLIREGVTGAASLPATLGLLALATATAPNASDPAATQAIGAFVLDQPSLIGATFFAVGSTIFCWLLLRGRMIPVALAWIGVVASLIVAIGLPLQLLGIVRGPLAQLIWLPMAAFEIPVGIWFIVKGVRPLGVSTEKGGEQS